MDDWEGRRRILGEERNGGASLPEGWGWEGGWGLLSGHCPQEHPEYEFLYFCPSLVSTGQFSPFPCLPASSHPAHSPLQFFQTPHAPTTMLGSPTVHLRCIPPCLPALPPVGLPQSGSPRAPFLLSHISGVLSLTPFPILPFLSSALVYFSHQQNFPRPRNPPSPSFLCPSTFAHSSRDPHTPSLLSSLSAPIFSLPTGSLHAPRLPT